MKKHEEEEAYKIELDLEVINVSLNKYKKVTDEKDWAINFFKKNSKNKKNLFGQMITVYTLPMTEDKKSGYEHISDNEYLCIQNTITY